MWTSAPDQRTDSVLTKVNNYLITKELETSSLQTRKDACVQQTPATLCLQAQAGIGPPWGGGTMRLALIMMGMESVPWDQNV
jgi:hypothetical protein